MSIAFHLAGAHPEFARQIEETMRALSARYPFAPLRSVSLYEPRGNDRSMGATYPGGRIEFNRYWFAGDPDRLNDAAKRDVLVETGGGRIGWHGRGVEEPDQVLHHEFGHVVNQAAPKLIDPWAKERWLAATRNPQCGPTGYALGSEPAEWFAEMFALCSLGLASREEQADMDALLSRV